MTPLKFEILLVLAALLLAACSAPPAQQPTSTSTPPIVTGPETAPAASAAQQALAKKLNLPVNSITVESIESMDWPDSCLGLPNPGEMCAMIVMTGYKIVLSANSQTYIARTNRDGSEVRIPNPSTLPNPTPTSTPLVSSTEITPTEVTQAVETSRSQLADQLNIEAASIILLGVEAVTWPDSCLGVPSGKACLTVLTPGLKIVFEAGGKKYEVHTDSSGKNIILVSNPPFSMVPTIIWQSPDPPCQMVSITLSGLFFGSCQDVLKIGEFVNTNRVNQLSAFVDEFASFGAKTPAGNITFNGLGQATATPAEQRAIAEWASLVFMEAQAGRGGAAWGLAFSWHRQGGIAGFCDDLGVYLDGEVVATSCKGQQLKNGGDFLLTSDQLDQLYGWVDQFQSFEVNQADQAVADSMAVTMSFNGTGNINPNQANRQEILSFASEIFLKAGQ